MAKKIMESERGKRKNSKICTKKYEEIEKTSKSLLLKSDMAKANIQLCPK